MTEGIALMLVVISILDVIASVMLVVVNCVWPLSLRFNLSFLAANVAFLGISMAAYYGPH